MNENPSQSKTIVTGAGETVGSKCYGYMLKGGSALTTVEFRDGSGAGAILWDDEVAIGARVRHTFTKPLGRQGTGNLFVVVAGTGGSIQLQVD